MIVKFITMKGVSSIAAIRAVFMVLAEFIRENQRKGNITYLDGAATTSSW